MEGAALAIDRTFDSSQIYYDPEKAGFEPIAKMEKEPYYSFDIFLVVRDKESGELYYAQDSGCSCPSPFEEVTRLSDLTWLDPNKLDAFEAEAMAWRSGYGPLEMESEDLPKFMRRVRVAVGVRV